MAALKERLTKLSLEEIGLVSEFIDIVSKGAVISFFADVKVEKAARLGLVEVMIDLVVTLFVLSSEQSHIIVSSRIAEVRMMRAVSVRMVAITWGVFHSDI
jgi:hypothetical protein